MSGSTGAVPSVPMSEAEMLTIIMNQQRSIDQLMQQMTSLQSQLAQSQAQVVTYEAPRQPTLQASKIKVQAPPQFDGTPSKLASWLFQVKQYCDVVRLEDTHDRVRFAVTLFTGQALVWWRQCVAKEADALSLMDWDDLESGLETAFEDVDKEMRLRRRLAGLRQTGSVQMYTKSFRGVTLELGNKAPDDGAQLFMYVEGLKPAVKTQVLLQRPQFLAEAEQLAERADAALFSGNRQWTRPPPPRRDGPVPMELGSAQGQFNGRSNVNRFSQGQSWQRRQSGQNGQQGRQAQVKCYGCGQIGHIRRNCPQQNRTYASVASSSQGQLATAASAQYSVVPPPPPPVFGVVDDNSFAGLPIFETPCGSLGSCKPTVTLCGSKGPSVEGGNAGVLGHRAPLDTKSAWSHRKGVDRHLDKRVSGQPDPGGLAEQTELALGLSVANNLVCSTLSSSPLLMVRVEFPKKVVSRSVEGLIDSGASYNFISRQLATELGWKGEMHSRVVVRLADGSSVDTSLACSGLVQIGQLQHVVPFLILDLTFDMVLGMPWLQFSNVLINWSTGSVRMRRGSRFVQLPARFNGPIPGLQQSASIEPTQDNRNRGFELTSASKFSRLVQQGQEVFCCLVNQVTQQGDLHFVHRAAHGGEVVSERSAASEKMLDKLEEQFPVVFAEPSYPIWHQRQPFTIPLIDPSKQPPRRRLYPLSQAELDELKVQIKALVDSGRIVPSSSPYGHPVLFAEKKGGGGLRLCIDYRTLNANTVNDAWPLPRIDELLSRLQGARIFSKLDLRDGYHQIPIEPADRYKTAFVCRYGAFEYTVMTFGFKNAPAHFQRAMNLMLGDLVDTCVLVYLDDILIFSRTLEEHEEHVKLVFERLAQNQFHVKRKKCEMFLPKVEFLGHQVSAKGIQVVESKVDAVVKWPTPTCIRDVQAFLGLCNYYRRFIKSFAQLALPLTNLTRKATTFEWNSGCQNAFEDLKRRLTSAPILQVYDPQRTTQLWVDASDFAVGATLVQQDPASGLFLPVEYMSHRLSAAECNYSATEREFVAIVSGLKKWRHYLVGKPCVVCTDHASLKWLMSQPQLSRRQVRWLDFLSQFDLKVEHVPGREHVVADALSRRPDLAVISTVESDWLPRIRAAQERACNPTWQQLLVNARVGDRGYAFKDGLLVRERGAGSVTIVIPEEQELRDDILRMHHDDPCGGHLGVYRLVGAISKRYYWKGLHQDCKAYVAKCMTCQAAKVSTQKPIGQLQPLPTPDYVFEQVTMDLITHLPKTGRGFDSICTFVDRLSKFVYFVPCRETITAEELAQLFLATVVSKHGMPRRLISDRDPRFVSKFWQALFASLGCKHSLSSAYHPETDGQSERMHRSIEQILRCYVSAQQDNWDLLLPTCEFALNTTRNASTGYSPAYVLFGRDPVLPLEYAVRQVTDSPLQSVTDKVNAMQSTVDLVKGAVTLAAQRMAIQANKHRRIVPFREGSYVWLSTEHLRLPQGLTRKLASKFVGPFLISKQVNPVAFQLLLPNTWRIHNVFHSSQLKPAVGFAGGTQFNEADESPFRPSANLDEEFEVEDILDFRQLKRGRSVVDEYLVKWKGYGVFESTWEPLSHLTNCPSILSSFRQRRGLR